MDIDNTYSIEEEEEIVDAAFECLDNSTLAPFSNDGDGSTLDVEKVVVILALFVIAFVVLSPRGSLRSLWKRWKAKRQAAAARRRLSSDPTVQITPTGSPKNSRSPSVEDNLSAIHESPRGVVETSSSPTTMVMTNTLCTGMVLPPVPPVVEEVTEEEKFAQLWPAIKMSNYRRLVLPPECKRVTKNEMRKEQKKHKDGGEHKTASSDDKKTDKDGQQKSNNNEDNPARRLVIYLQHFLSLIRSIYSYDYDGAARTVIGWLQTVIRYRRYKPPEEEEEEEDDDASVATVGSNTPRAGTATLGSPFPLGHSNSPRPQTTENVFVEEKKEASSPEGEQEHVMEEKPRARSNSMDSSIYELPLDDAGESDVGERSPVSPPGVPSVSRQKNGVKRKDALDNYRSSIPALKEAMTQSSPTTTTTALTPRLIHPNQQQSGVIFESELFTPVEKLPPERHAPERQASDSDSLKFFDAAHSKASLKRITREVGGVPDKNGYIVGDEFLDSRYTPLLVFVNSRSGPQQGHVLIMQLRNLLNPIQVWDLADGGPEEVLESFSAMSKFRILVCGGDGTVSWIISALEKMAMERWPPIAILPLGTGNDLAQIHGWGSGYNNESLILILEQISDAYISLLDRWEMTLFKKGKKKDVKSFTNYLGVGADAQAALQVHMLRESKPTLFFSRAVNKAWYAVFGAEDIIKPSCAFLPEEITLVADGVEVPLPPDSQGIILLNIDSYSGGVPFWSHGTKRSTTRHYSTVERRGFARRTQSFDCLHEGLNSSRSGDFDRVDSMDDLQSTTRSRSNTFERVDSMDDLVSAGMSDEEKLARVTACNMPSSCQDGVLDVVSIRGAFHLGQIRVGLSQAERLCQCREVTITIKKKVAVQVDGEPWRQNACTLQIKSKKDPAIMLHRSPDESGGVETEMAKLLDWAQDRGHIDRNVHSTLMKEFSRRIESKTRQRRVRSQDNLMLSLKRAIVNTGAPSFPPSSYDSSYAM